MNYELRIKNGYKSVFIAVLAIINCSLLITASAQAQSTFSLQQAIDYAYQHTSSTQNALLDEKITVAKVKEFTGTGLPQVKANADLKYFPQIPTTVAFNFPRPGPNALQFGTNYNTDIGASASWLVADASYFLAKRAQKEAIELMKYNTARTKVDAAEQVSKAYYTVLISEKKLGLLQANIDRLSKTLSDTKAYNEQGFVEKLDVERLQITLNNLKTEQTKIIELVELSRAALKFQIGYDVQQPIVLTDTLNYKMITPINDLQNNFDPSTRLEVKLLNKQMELNKLQLKAREWAWMPNLLAIGSYSLNHYSNDFDFYKHSSQYYPTSLVGVTVGSTIFDGRQNHYKKIQSRLQIQQNENDILNLKNAFQLELQNAKITLKNALLSIESQKANMTLATEVARVSKIKYQQGVGSNLEVLTDETGLKEAQTNYLSALYDAYIAKVNFEKATGTLIK